MGEGKKFSRKLALNLGLTMIGLVPFVILAIYFQTQNMLAFNKAPREPFDSIKWKASLAADNTEPVRLRMVDDLLAHKTLKGKSRKEIVDLLGMPPRTNYFSEYQYVYWLGPERGWMSLDSEWLCVKFRDDVVEDARLMRD